MTVVLVLRRSIDQVCGRTVGLGLARLTRYAAMTSAVRSGADWRPENACLDVVKAAILGAEGFGFGTAPMIALGCKFPAHLITSNFCTGVATQNEACADHFISTVENGDELATFVAETREWLASSACAGLEELIGRTDLLDMLPGETAKRQHLDLGHLLGSDHIPADKPQFWLLSATAVRKGLAGREDG